MPFAWTPAALDDLHRLYVREKLSARQTALAMGGGVTRGAVLGKTQRLGWTRDAAPKAGRPPQPVPPRAAKPSPAKAAAPRSDAPRVAAPRLRRAGPFSKVLPLPKLREITVVSTPRPWTERGERECAFPVGEPAEPGRQWSCCAPATRRRAYCAAHWKLMTLEEPVFTKQEVEIIAAIARRAA